MKKEKGLTAFIVATLVLTFIVMFARVKSVSSERSFDNAIVKNDLVVALFYRKGKEERKDKALRDKTDRLLSMYKSLSEKTRYKEADVEFVRINIAKNNLEGLADHYGISEIPGFILFNDGRQVADNGKRVVLTGFVSRAELTDFIESNLADEISEELEEKEEERERRAEEARYRDSSYPYYYGYYGYPYYGYYGYPYYYPYYYRRHYYPSYGFGFHFGGHHRHHGGHRGNRGHQGHRGHRGHHGGRRR